MSLILRLSLILSSMVTLAFFAFGWAEYRTLREAVLNEIDETLELRAQQVAQDLFQEDSAEKASVQERLDDHRSPEVYLQILGLDGSVKTSSRNLGGQSLPTPFELKTAHHETRQENDEGRMRLFVLPVPNGGGGDGVGGRRFRIVAPSRCGAKQGDSQHSFIWIRDSRHYNRVTCSCVE